MKIQIDLGDLDFKIIRERVLQYLETAENRIKALAVMILVYGTVTILFGGNSENGSTSGDYLPSNQESLENFKKGYEWGRSWGS